MSSNKKNLKIKFDPTDKQRVCWKKLRDNITEFVMFGGGAGGRQKLEWLRMVIIPMFTIPWY